MKSQKIILGHGSGGKLTHELIKENILPEFNNSVLNELSDSARINYKEKIAFTTDSFVVSPIFFSGGDLGKLSVCGTINDLVMMAAVPEYLSLSMIIEEGLDMRILNRIIHSVSCTAKKARVKIATGDIKVVERNACDKIFLNTAGIGRILPNKMLSLNKIDQSDQIIVTGNIAQHGLAVLTKRNDLDLDFKIKSDCAALNDLLLPVLKKIHGVKFMRDPTRGGLATTLNEITQATSLGAEINEAKIPISRKVKAACELLGIDPLYVANEGIAVIVVKKSSTDKVLDLLKKHPLGRNARIIGNFNKEREGKLVLNTILGTQRIVEMLNADPLPRIC